MNANANAAADLCRYLNELADIDRRAMYRQVRTLSPCNDAMRRRLTDHHVVVSDVGPMLGMLGVLNGWLSASGVAIAARLYKSDDMVGEFVIEDIATHSAEPDADAEPDPDAP